MGQGKASSGNGNCLEGGLSPHLPCWSPGRACGEVGILDRMRLAYRTSALSGIYTIFLHTHQLEWHWGKNGPGETGLTQKPDAHTQGENKHLPRSECISNFAVSTLSITLGPSVVYTWIPIISSHCYWNGLATVLPPQTERPGVITKQ